MYIVMNISKILFETNKCINFRFHSNFIIKTNSILEILFYMSILMYDTINFCSNYYKYEQKWILERMNEEK